MCIVLEITVQHTHKMARECMRDIGKKNNPKPNTQEFFLIILNKYSYPCNTTKTLKKKKKKKKAFKRQIP